jgi:hypothetical protein
MEKMLASLPFATTYLDDTVVVSRSQDDHRRHLHAVFDRINEYGFCMHPGKCSFFQPSIKYLWFIVDKEGHRPDPQNITAVADMPAPSNITTLRSFLGLVNYYQSFVPNMRSICQPQSSATTGHSLPHASSGSSARLTPSVTFCLHRTTPNQMVKPNTSSTPSSAASSN